MESKICKVLLLGNNSQSTDEIATHNAKKYNLNNLGLVDTLNITLQEFGYYHTSVADLSFGQIVLLGKKFDLIELSDEPIEYWSHHRIFLQSYKLLREFDRLGVCTNYLQNNNVKTCLYFEKLLVDNPSFCMFPWIAFHPKEGNYYPCPRFLTPVKKIEDIVDFQNDEDLVQLRTSMLAGEKHSGCKTCYMYEENGIESYRQFESKDWISQLGIRNLGDLLEIQTPYYYEIFVNNVCNLMCRSCDPDFSHLIAKEAVEHGLIAKDSEIKRTYSSTDHVDIATLNKKSRVYIHGGEPTIIPEVYDFLQKCITQGKTNFQLAFCTNGQQFNKKFLGLIEKFSNVHFSFSIDGYGPINDYWRHGSDWDTIIDNMHLVESLGHKTSFNTVPGIYNVTNLHLLLQFADAEFPHSTFYMQINNKSSQDVYNHPDPSLVCYSMEQCKKTNVYYSDGKSNKTCIDSIYEYYANSPVCNIDNLRNFFTENDRLDKIRNIKLKDYIPELDACRQYL